MTGWICNNLIRIWKYHWKWNIERYFHLSLHFHIFSPFPLHLLILSISSTFPHCRPISLQPYCRGLWQPDSEMILKICNIPMLWLNPFLSRLNSNRKVFSWKVIPQWYLAFFIFLMDLMTRRKYNVGCLKVTSARDQTTVFRLTPIIFCTCQ